MPDGQAFTETSYDRRYYDKHLVPEKGQIARLAFLLAGCLIILASVSLVFTGQIASREADQRAKQSQEQLLDVALEDRFLLLARDQRSLARWDEAVKRISLFFDRRFVEEEFIDSLWFDFGLDYNLLVGPDDKILAEAVGEDVSFANSTINDGNPLWQLIREAREYYFDNRYQLGTGFALAEPKEQGDGPLPSHGFLKLAGGVAMVHAMPLVPDDGLSQLPDGNPVVLISAKYLDEDLIRSLNKQLLFTSLQFSQDTSPMPSATQHAIVSTTGNPVGVFSWSASLPGNYIWRTVIPVIAVLSMALALVAFTIAWKIGRLTASLSASEEQNRYLALHDPLSGLANRLACNRALQSAIADLPHQPFTIIQCDLDRFKAVNDTYGHAAGDEVIKVVARRLQQVVAEKGLAGRVGGDEFIILLPGNSDRAKIEELCQELITDICQTIPIGNGDHAQIGTSLGIAFAPANGTDDKTLLAAADTALYHAKESGRNRAVFYGPPESPSS